MFMSSKYTIKYFIGFLFIVFASCSGNITKSTMEDNLVIFPPPPDTARIQFLTKISSSKDVIGKQSFFSKFILGEEEPKQINKPYGIEINKGKIYVCDVSIKGLEVIDLKEQTFEYFIPKGKGVLKMPVNCFVDENGFLYVADIQRKQVVIFDDNLRYFGSLAESENFKPSDVFVIDNKIWVSNNANNRISIFSKETFEFLDYFPKSEEGDDGFLYSPTNIFITNDKVYVSDFGDFKIKIYTHKGDYLNSVGSYGNHISQFVRPKGIAVDRNSNLYVVDAGFENVQIFDRDNQLLMFFGGSYKGPGDMWLPAKVIIDYDNLEFFTQYVDSDYALKYLVLVTNQYGPDKISVYGAIETK